MTDRSDTLRRVTDRLGHRRLFWSGLRSDDVEAITDVPQLEGGFSIIGGYERSTVVQSLEFEQMWGARMDLDAWDIDGHPDHTAVAEFRNEILHHLVRPSALVVYRPTRFLSSVAFSRRDRCLYLGLFGEHQAAFDHKPWVESGLDELGIARIPWSYVANEERHRVDRLLDGGPLMLRPSRSSGGTGLVRVEHPDDVDRAWPVQADSFASVTRYLDGAIPVNVGGTVWRDGHVTLRHPSVQLIGVPACTDKPFGYCGNDFGAIRDLDRAAIDAIDANSRLIGGWLSRFGYLGTFGVDFLVHEGVPLFTEVNPRFQGSTHASCRLSIEADETCLMLDHIASFLGLEAPRSRSLRDMQVEMPNLASFVVHRQGLARSLDSRPLADELRAALGWLRTDVQADPSLPCEPGSTILRATSRARLTTSGFDLTDPCSTIVSRWTASIEGGER